MLSSSRLLRPCLRHTWLRRKHKVRVILKEDVGENTAGSVLTVSAGHARNYMVPKKMAIYAIPENFAKLGIKDPAIETPAERKERLAREAADAANVELIAANMLKKYLNNKQITIWRMVGPETKMTHPGMVVEKNLREKLSKQLKIELEDHEQIHIHDKTVGSHERMEAEELDEIMSSIDTSSPCKVQLRQLGNYVAKITLAGDYEVPLKFEVLKR